MSEQTVLRLPNPTRSIESIQFNQPLTIPYSGGVDSSRDPCRLGRRRAHRSEHLHARRRRRLRQRRRRRLPRDAAVGDRAAAGRERRGVQRRHDERQRDLRPRQRRAVRRRHQARHQPLPRIRLLLPSGRRVQRQYLDPQSSRVRSSRSSRTTVAGFSLGGPIQSNKTFFFTNYEARRFPRTTRRQPDGADRLAEGRASCCSATPPATSTATTCGRWIRAGSG